MKKVFTVMIMLVALLSTTCYAAEKNYELIETTYTVQEDDTLRSIASSYIEKNTYGAREIREFTAGIKELNPWLLNRSLTAGDKLRINYWIKK
jgi:hypothetical protein